MHYLANSTAHCGGQLRKGRRGWWSKDSEIASHWMIGRWHGRRVGDTVMVAAIKTLALIDCDSEEMPELKYTHGEVCPWLRIWRIPHHTSFQDTVGGIGSKYTPVPTWKLPKEQVGILYAEESSRRPPERLKFVLRSDNGSTDSWDVKAERPRVWGQTGLHSPFQEQRKIPLIILFRKDFPKTSLISKILASLQISNLEQLWM